MIINLFFLTILIAFIFYLVTFVYTSFRGSPYVPIKDRRIKNITSFIKKGDRVADLGCGDGRVLFAAINKGAARADGWESDFAVFAKAVFNTKANRLGDKVKIHFADFWYADLSGFNVIYTYQMTKYMGDFKTKLLPQLKKGTLIISPDYTIPGLKLHKKLRDADRGIYIYKV